LIFFTQGVALRFPPANRRQTSFVSYPPVAPIPRRAEMQKVKDRQLVRHQSTWSEWRYCVRFREAVTQCSDQSFLRAFIVFL